MKRNKSKLVKREWEKIGIKIRNKWINKHTKQPKIKINERKKKEIPAKHDNLHFHLQVFLH